MARGYEQMVGQAVQVSKKVRVQRLGLVERDRGHGEQQQNYMRKRVLFQAVAIVVVILILIVAGQAGK